MIEVAGAVRPRRGERRCGDAWLHLEHDGNSFIALIDALGHGPAAADVADLAVQFLKDAVVREQQADDLSRVMAGLHRALRGSRGVVAALASVEPARSRVHYLAVGNTEAHVMGTDHVRLISAFGLLGGGRPPRLRPQVAELRPGSLIVLHTDGLMGARMDAISPGASCEAIARFLIERWARAEDDGAVVVARVAGAS